MNKQYNIYFTTNRLVISTTPVDGIPATISPEKITSPQELQLILSSFNNVAIITPNTKECFDKISALFTPVTAAGGLATNARGEYLMIFRNNRWDLPKGHWESGESIEECAIREVEEETGASELTIGEKICTTIHIYKMYSRWEMKQTHWFAMTCTSDNPLTPQREEGIMRVEWCAKEQIQRFIPSSYPTIQQVFIDAGVL